MLEAPRSMNISVHEKKIVDEVLDDEPAHSRTKSFVAEKLPNLYTDVPSDRELVFRQLFNDAKITKEWDKEIEVQLRELVLNGDRPLKHPFSTMTRALWIVMLKKPQDLDIENLEWRSKHHLSMFKQKSDIEWFKENLHTGTADKRLKILKEAATKWDGELGPQLVIGYKVRAEANHKVHPEYDLEKVMSDSKTGAFAFYGVDLRMLVERMCTELKKLAS